VRPPMNHNHDCSDALHPFRNRWAFNHRHEIKCRVMSYLSPSGFPTAFEFESDLRRHVHSHATASWSIQITFVIFQVHYAKEFRIPACLVLHFSHCPLVMPT
jgi:hypothetical protein